MKMNIVNLFKELKDKYKVSFIYITHDLSTAYYVSDYIATAAASLSTARPRRSWTSLHTRTLSF